MRLGAKDAAARRFEYTREKRSRANWNFADESRADGLEPDRQTWVEGENERKQKRKRRLVSKRTRKERKSRNVREKERDKERNTYNEKGYFGSERESSACLLQPFSNAITRGVRARNWEGGRDSKISRNSRCLIETQVYAHGKIKRETNSPQGLTGNALQLMQNLCIQKSIIKFSNFQIADLKYTHEFAVTTQIFSFCFVRLSRLVSPGKIFFSTFPVQKTFTGKTLHTY